jgi:hypothetical protein
MFVLAYLWLLAIVPLVTERQDEQVQWHARHGLVLTVTEGAVLIAFGLLTSFVGLAAFGIGLAMGIIAIFIGITLCVHFLAILRALNGDRLTVPGITPLADRLNISL